MGRLKLSTISTMSQNIKPAFVYRRRGHFRKSLDDPSDGSQSVISSEALSVTAKENMVSFFECINATAKKSPIRRAGSMSGADGVPSVVRVNDNCSSGECSSSGALIAEKVLDEMSHRDICALILKNQGLLPRVCRPENIDVGSDDNYCSKACKICARSDSTSNMLICDDCTDAFHMSCCHPSVTRIPAGDWLCGPCLENKRKILNEMRKSTSDDINISENSASEGELGRLEFMFRDIEPYMSNVRIGDDFQANVPNWSGPVYDECDNRWLQTDPSTNIRMQEQSYTKNLKQSSIGNWLQCRESIRGVGDGDQGTICRKWRRAPLFEVQSDKWVCFSCVVWDPFHADCAVPQELGTEEVMEQLKYMEMLRPKLTAKRRKLDFSKRISSQHNSK